MSGSCQTFVQMRHCSSCTISDYAGLKGRRGEGSQRESAVTQTDRQTVRHGERERAVTQTDREKEQLVPRVVRGIGTDQPSENVKITIFLVLDGTRHSRVRRPIARRGSRNSWSFPHRLSHPRKSTSRTFGRAHFGASVPAVPGDRRPFVVRDKSVLGVCVRA